MTKKQIKFAQLVAAGNITVADAARQAGYSQKSAVSTGCQLMNLPSVSDYIKKLRLSAVKLKDEILANRGEQSAVVSVVESLQILGRMIRKYDVTLDTNNTFQDGILIKGIALNAELQPSDGSDESEKLRQLFRKVSSKEY